MKAKKVGFIDFAKIKKAQIKKYHLRPMEDTVYRPFTNLNKIIKNK